MPGVAMRQQPHARPKQRKSVLPYPATGRGILVADRIGFTAHPFEQILRRKITAPQHATLHPLDGGFQIDRRGPGRNQILGRAAKHPQKTVETVRRRTGSPAADIHAVGRRHADGRRPAHPESVNRLVNILCRAQPHIRRFVRQTGLVQNHHFRRLVVETDGPKIG